MDNVAIQLKNVCKTIGDREILSDVSFSITSQSLVSLIGPNGAGKSTLIKIILGLDTTYTGTVHISPSERIQYIPQQPSADPHQLPLSVYEYLRIGSTPLYSQQPPVTDFVPSLSHVGITRNILQQTFQSLSGGERQRVAIARALLGNPTMLVLDEPLAAVDYHSRLGLYQLIRHLQQDHAMTVLLVSHDIDSVLPLSDRVLCLNRTLHTDCHPTEMTDHHSLYQPVHHHC